MQAAIHLNEDKGFSHQDAGVVRAVCQEVGVHYFTVLGRAN